MNFLLCSPQDINQSMGISRVLIEIQNELISTGHQCNLVGPKDIGCTLQYSTKSEYLKHYSSKLRQYIILNGAEYDVIDVDHEFLPFDRSEFGTNFLLVARTVLLVQHLKYISFPRRRNVRHLAGHLFKFFFRNREQRARIKAANKTFTCVDLINVPNNKDKKLLVKLGIQPEKIVVIPYGLSSQRVKLFDSASPVLPSKVQICFVGTFDYRKGAIHFAKFLTIVSQVFPEVSLKLIGCKGMFQTEREILDFFPEHLRSQVEIVLQFDREKIVEQLKDCRLGIFPSYMEGFPFGILEMMMANIPVLAFDAPGADMMVSSEHLVATGDVEGLAKKTIALLKNSELLKIKREEARASVKEFTWANVTKQTILSYKHPKKVFE